MPQTSPEQLSGQCSLLLFHHGNQNKSRACDSICELVVQGTLVPLAATWNLNPRNPRCARLQRTCLAEPCCLRAVFELLMPSVLTSRLGSRSNLRQVGNSVAAAGAEIHIVYYQPYHLPRIRARCVEAGNEPPQTPSNSLMQLIYGTSGCSSQGFSWSLSNRYLHRSKLASTRLCNNHI